MSSNDLRQRYANAIGFAPCTPFAIADAVLAVRDDELAAALARADRMAEMVIEKDREATQWADWLHQAEAAIARVQDRMLTGEAWAHRELSNDPQARDHVLAVIADLRIALDGVGAASGLLLEGGT